MLKPLPRRIVEGPNPGEYVLVEADGTVIRTGKNPDHLSNWSLADNAEVEVQHKYNCVVWGEVGWPRPR
jgi:hypothetical protein